MSRPIPTEEYYQKLLSTVKFKKTTRFEARLSIERIAGIFATYRSVSALTGVPPEIIAAIHHKEASGKFTKHLHNGDPLIRRTVRVPKGRPIAPPKNTLTGYTWEESAIDALERFKKYKVWSPIHRVARLEAFNGLGYFWRGIPSPYVWCGTNHYVVGGYPKDGVWDPTYKIKNLGTYVIETLITEFFNTPKKVLEMVEVEPLLHDEDAEFFIAMNTHKYKDVA